MQGVFVEGSVHFSQLIVFGHMCISCVCCDKLVTLVSVVAVMHCHIRILGLVGFFSFNLLSGVGILYDWLVNA